MLRITEIHITGTCCSYSRKSKRWLCSFFSEGNSWSRPWSVVSHLEQIAQLGPTKQRFNQLRLGESSVTAAPWGTTWRSQKRRKGLEGRWDGPVFHGGFSNVPCGNHGILPCESWFNSLTLDEEDDDGFEILQTVSQDLGSFHYLNQLKLSYFIIFYHIVGSISPRVFGISPLELTQRGDIAGQGDCHR